MARKLADRGRGLDSSLLKTGTGSGFKGVVVVLMSGCAVVWYRDPLRAAGLYPEAFVAPPAEVSTFSLVAPCLVEKCLAAPDSAIFQLAVGQFAWGHKIVECAGKSGAGEWGGSKRCGWPGAENVEDMGMWRKSADRGRGLAIGIGTSKAFH